MLEAYALGAVAPEEGAHIEEHLAECLACWEHLSESQRAAALLALAVPLKEPHENLRRRIIAQAKLEGLPVAASLPTRTGWRLPRFAAFGAAAVTVAAVGALSWSLVETRHLRSDYHDIQQQAVISAQQVSLTRQLAGIEGQEMKASGRAVGASAYYMWTRDGKQGAIICHDLPSAPEGKVYQLWITCGPEPVNGGTFMAWQGECQQTVSLKCTSELSGVNVTLEPAGGSVSPSDEVVLTASFSGP